MPASRLTNVPVSCSVFSVVGTARKSDVKQGAVNIRHVGLLSPTRPMTPGTVPTSSHNLSQGSQPECDHVCRVPAEDGQGDPLAVRVCMNHPVSQTVAVAVGYPGQHPSDSLSADSIETIEAYLQSVKYRKYTFLCVPPIQTTDPDSGLPTIRFSCAGLVLQCYREIGIDLLADSETNSNYPTSTKQQLVHVWPELGRLSDAQLADVGLEGGGDWPVVLPSHILHSFVNLSNTPYLPTDADRTF